MGKTSKYPKYSTGSVEINGNTVASTTKKDKNNISSSYNMTDTEKSIYDGVQQNLSTSLANLFKISDETQKSWQEELDNYRNTGIEEIENIYTPMETELRNNIASRFGNLDNSVFMDKLDAITDKKADAIAELSDNLVAKRDELYSTELANRLNYISLLNDLNTSMNSNILNYLTFAQSNAESGNKYSNQSFTAQNENQRAWLNTYVNAATSLAKTASGLK
ncbi:MAG: hypothetical protein E7Z87_02920 [Cyanobacteria bacterium SIG26]|nr:hypothetical protein [Cyanobacteria bacterium SIG26]